MQKARIIIVEDDIIIADTIRDYLLEYGYEVPCIIASGEEAIEKAEELQPDIILMDILLSGEMDGIDAAEMILGRYGIPVIYITAHTDDGTILRARDTLPYGYLVKPVSGEDIYIAIEMALHRSHLEKKLRESEARYRAIVDDQTELICRFKPDGTVTFVNEAYLRYFQKAYDEIVGNTFMPLITDEDRDYVNENIASLNAENSIITHEHRIISPDGEIRWQQWTNRALFDESGVLSEYQAVGRDVTDRKLTELALRESEHSYRTLAENIPGIVYRSYQEGGNRMLFFNDMVREITGYGEDELTFGEVCSIDPLIVPEDRPQVVAAVDDAVERGAPFSSEYRIRNRDGEIRHLISIGRPVSVTGGKPRYIDGIIFDITAQKEAEEKLKESEARWRAISENSPDYVMLLDRDANIIFINRPLPYMKREEVIGTSYLDHTMEEYREVAGECFRDVLSTGEQGSFDSAYRNPDDMLRYFATCVGPVYDGTEIVGLTVSSRDITGRKLIEEELQVKEEKYRMLVENVNDIIYELDEQGRIAYVSPTVERYGYQRHDVLGKSFADFTFTEDVPVIAGGFERIMNGGEPTPTEFRMLSNEGGFMWMRALGSPVIRDGRIAGSRGVLSDITERKRAEEALRESEERFRKYFELGLVGIAIETPEGEWIEVNEYLCDMFGYSREELMEKHWRDITHPDDLEKDIDLYNKLNSGAINHYSMEKRFIRKGGSSIFCIISVTCTRDRAGNTDRIYAYAVDITERKRAEEALRERERSYRTLAENIPGIVYRITIDGLKSMQFYNDMLHELTGYSESELSFGDVCSIDPLIVDDDRPAVIEEVKSAMKESRPFEIEYRLRTKYGEIRYFREIGRPVSDSTGKCKYIDGIIFDITEGKKAEERLRISEERLSLAMEATSDGLWDRNIASGEVFYSPRWYSMLGYEPYEFPATFAVFSDLIHPDDRKRVIRELHNSVERGIGTYEIEFRLRAKNGDYRWILSRGKVVEKDEEGNPLRFIGTHIDITDRIRYEERLRESEEKARSIMNAIPDAIFQIDRHGDFVDLNRAMAERFGREADELIGAKSYDILPEEVARFRREKVEHVFATGEPVQFEDLREGMWNETHIYPVRDSDGRVIRVTVIGRDITDRMQYEKKLRESEHRFRELFENMKSGVIIYQPVNGGEDFTVIDFNRTAEQMNKISREEAIGKSVLEILPGVMESGIFETLQRVCRSGTSELHPVSLYRDRRTYNWRECSVFPLPTGEIVEICDDVDDRVFMENQRDQAYAELDQIFNTTPIGMWLIDRDYTVVRLNDAFRRMFGVAGDAVQGRKCHQIWEIRPCEAEQCPLKAIVNGDTTWEHEIKRRSIEGGESRICAVKAVPFVSSSGEMLGMLESFVDITDLRELQREIVNISENERRRIAQDLHDDLGQKLSYVGFLAEALKRKLRDEGCPAFPEVDELIEVVGDSVEHTRTVARGLYPVGMEPYGFLTAIEELVESTARFLDVKIKIRKRGDIFIDDKGVATHLYHIVQESLNNAIRHGGAKHITVRLRSDSKKFSVRIEDDGTMPYGEDAAGEGMGLKIMKYRADLIGAEFGVSREKRGFVVEVLLRRDS